MRGDATEGCLLTLQIAEHRIAEHLLAVAGLVAAVASRLGARRAEVHQHVWIGDRQRTQQHLVEDGVDGGIGTDFEGQCQHGHQRERRALEEETRREADVLAERAGEMRQPAPPLHADAAIGAVTSTGLPVAELANRLCPRRRSDAGRVRRDGPGGGGAGGG